MESVSITKSNAPTKTRYARAQPTNPVVKLGCSTATFVSASFPSPIRHPCENLTHTLRRARANPPPKRRRAFVVHCEAAAPNEDAERKELAKLEGELRDMFKEALSREIRDSDKEVLRDSDQRVVGGITDLAMDDIEGIAGDIKSELEDVEAISQQYASNLMAEAADSLLEKYEDQREELLQTVSRDRGLIQDELHKIEKLSESVKSSRRSRSDLSTKGKLLFLLAGMFGVGALIYGWTGFIESDSAAVQNAAIDALFAAIAAFFYSQEKLNS